MRREWPYVRLCQCVLAVPVGLLGLICLFGGGTDRSMGSPGRITVAALGLLLLAIAVVLARGWLGRRLAQFRAPLPNGDVIALCTYRFSWRKPYLELRDDTVRVVLPRYFGLKPWTIPAGSMAVTPVLEGVPTSEPDLPSESPTGERDTTERPASQGPDHGGSFPPISLVPLLKHPPTGAADVVFQARVMVPYLPTASEFAVPTLLVLFSVPQRVPPARLFAGHLGSDAAQCLGYFSSQSDRGTLLDGVKLRVADRESVVARLVAAGAHHTEDPIGWLGRHRDLSTDPAERTALVRQERHTRLMSRTAGYMIFVGLVGHSVLTILGYHGGRIRTITVGLAVGGLALRWIAVRHIKARYVMDDDQV